MPSPLSAALGAREFDAEAFARQAHEARKIA